MQEIAVLQKSLVQLSDGFATRKSSKRTIRGQLLKFVDGRLSVDGQPFSNEQNLLVQDIAQVGQYFPEDGPPESFFIDDENPISRIDELNSRIPEKDWKIGLSGQPEKPWKLNDAVYLVKENDGSVYTMINSTVGMRIAVETLCSQVEMTRKLRGGVPVLPIVKIGSALMKTKFGVKSRPSFEIVGWKGLANERPLLKEVPAPTASEIVNDSLPGDPPRPAKKPKAITVESAAPWDDPIDDLIG